MKIKGVWVVVVLVVLVGLSGLYEKLGNSDDLQISKKLEQELNLPPDPGEAGKQTVGGIDSDGDGIRDDVQRYIVTAYPDSPTRRAALEQFAVVSQRALEPNLTDKLVDEVLLSTERAISCIRYVFGSGEEARNARAKLSAVVENTDERMVASFEFGVLTGGKAMYGTPPNERRLACDFDPDSVE